MVHDRRPFSTPIDPKYAAQWTAILMRLGLPVLGRYLFGTNRMHARLFQIDAFHYNRFCGQPRRCDCIAQLPSDVVMQSIAAEEIGGDTFLVDGKQLSLALVHTDGRSAALRTRNIGERGRWSGAARASRTAWSSTRQAVHSLDKKRERLRHNFPRGPSKCVIPPSGMQRRLEFALAKFPSIH